MFSIGGDEIVRRIGIVLSLFGTGLLVITIINSKPHTKDPAVFSDNMSEPLERSASKAYWLLPIFLGFIGCVIQYFAVRNKDPKMAKRSLILLAILLVVFIVMIVLSFTLGLLVDF